MSDLKLPRTTEQANNSFNMNSKKRFVNKIFGSDGFNFKDVLDLINPLHHIPIVGAVYRSISKDKIAPAIKLAGGALFGGVAGAGLAADGAPLRELRERKKIAAHLANNRQRSQKSRSFDPTQ